MGVIVKNRPYYQSSNRIIPPYPALNVEISDSVDSKRISVLAVIDLAADITCVSEEKIKELEIVLGHPLMVQSFPIVDSQGEIIEELQTYDVSYW
jgi:hypothetical protein